jgi:hypothetical protein
MAFFLVPLSFAPLACNFVGFFGKGEGLGVRLSDEKLGSSEIREFGMMLNKLEYSPPPKSPSLTTELCEDSNPRGSKMGTFSCLHPALGWRLLRIANNLRQE